MLGVFGCLLLFSVLGWCGILRILLVVLFWVVALDFLQVCPVSYGSTWFLVLRFGVVCFRLLAAGWFWV